jgi:hypothetical protein
MAGETCVGRVAPAGAADGETQAGNQQLQHTPHGGARRSRAQPAGPPLAPQSQPRNRAQRWAAATGDAFRRGWSAATAKLLGRAVPEQVTLTREQAAAAAVASAAAGGAVALLALAALSAALGSGGSGGAGAGACP